MKLSTPLTAAVVALGVSSSHAFFAQPGLKLASPARAVPRGPLARVGRHAVRAARTAPVLNAEAAMAEPEPEKTFGSRRLGKMVRFLSSWSAPVYSLFSS